MFWFLPKPRKKGNRDTVELETVSFLYSNHIFKLYEAFIESGGCPNTFYNYSMDELDLIIKSKNTAIKNDLLRVQDLAVLIVNGVASLFSKEVKSKTILDLYPNLFEKEIEEQRQKEIELYKAKMDLYMALKNKKRSEADE